MTSMKPLALALLALLPAQDAPKQATFEVRHELKITVPEGAKRLRAWFVLPQGGDASQVVKDLKIDAPFATRTEKDSEGNEVLYLEAESPKQKEFAIVETFTVTRKEIRSGVDAAKADALSDEDRKKFAKELAANENVVINDEIRELSAKIVGGEKNPVLAARKLYDWVLANIEYWVKDPAHKKASPVGSSTYCLANKTGNCTDFHSLWTALARAAGIPTRMVYGSFFKKSLDGQDKDQSYHCWPEFFVTGQGWIPHDVAVADIFVGDFPLNDENREKVTLTTADGYTAGDKAKVDYYFGNIEERRVVWSRGRDILLTPKQDGAPVNAMAKAYVEVDGKKADEKTVWNRKLTFKEIR